LEIHNDKINISAQEHTQPMDNVEGLLYYLSQLLSVAKPIAKMENVIRFMSNFLFERVDSLVRKYEEEDKNFSRKCEFLELKKVCGIEK